MQCLLGSHANLPYTKMKLMWFFKQWTENTVLSRNILLEFHNFRRPMGLNGLCSKLFLKYVQFSTIPSNDCQMYTVQNILRLLLMCLSASLSCLEQNQGISDQSIKDHIIDWMVVYINMIKQSFIIRDELVHIGYYGYIVPR